jgi:hypothetical protein
VPKALPWCVVLRGIKMTLVTIGVTNELVIADEWERIDFSTAFA